MKLSLSWIRDYVNIPEDADLKKAGVRSDNVYSRSGRCGISCRTF
mgnify:FL=1